MMLVSLFAADGHFQSVPARSVTHGGIRLHPRVTYLPNLMLGPYVPLSDGGVLTMHDRSAYVSYDEGNTWQTRWSFDSRKKLAFSGERALIRTQTGTLICVFLNQALRKWGWDRTSPSAGP